MNVIIYKRVSTDDQADRGFSLQHQEDVMRKYCEINKYNIVGVYTEDYSAKTFDRPEWKKILEYIRKNKGAVDSVLCLRWDRFSRNAYESFTVIKQLAKLGVSVNTVEQQLDLSNPDSKMLLSLYLTLPEIENDKISRNTIDGSRRARLEGCWTGTAPRGYKNFRDDDEKSTLRPTDDAPLIIQAFEKMATSAYSAEAVRRWLKQQGIKLSKQAFLNIIRNPVYIGKIKVKEWKKEPSVLAVGIHPPLISEQLFYQANQVLDGRKRNMKFHKDKTDMYPLKGFLKCPIHGVSLTAYAAKSRNKQLHHYYLCAKDRCKHRYRIKDVHESVEDILSQISISAQAVNLYKRILEKIFERDDHVRKDEIQKIRSEMEKKKQRISNLQDQLMDKDITPQEFHEMKNRVDIELALLNGKLETLTTGAAPYKTYISKTIPLLQDLDLYYRKSDGQTKRKILGCIFSEKLILEKGRVATTPFSIPIQVLFNASKVLDESPNKKEVANDLQSIMAPAAGLEPATL